MSALIAFLAAIRKAFDVAGTTTTNELQTEAGATITDEAGNPLLTEAAVAGGSLLIGSSADEFLIGSTADILLIAE